MNALVSSQIFGSIIVVTIDNPPVNALNANVRRGLVDAVLAAQSDDAVEGIVIFGAKGIFSGGADIKEFDAEPHPPALPEIIDIIEGSGKPVIAAIEGQAIGGGLEIALGCHLRFASARSRLALPEVKLGLLPGAGGTQRLPRLIGIGEALNVMVSGDPLTASRALDLGLIDAVLPAEDLLDGALARLRDRIAAGAASRRTLDIPAPAADAIDAACDAFLEGKRFKGAEAPARIVETVRLGLKGTSAEGLAIERAAFLALSNGAQSKAMRYAFFSERAARKVPGIAGAVPRSVGHVGIVGAGTMGSGIALAFLGAGFRVTIYEQSSSALERGRQVIAQTIARNVASGRISESSARAAEMALHTGCDMAALADCDLIIEAAFETMDVKTSVFAALDAVAKPGAILASNTSYLDIDQIAAATSRAPDVVGLHFFSPANIMKLMEIVRGRETAPEVLATAIALAQRIGKAPVVAGNAHGFIGNRMLAVRTRQAEQLLLSGASPYHVDRVIEAFGLPMGPYRMGDLAGLDLGWVKEKSQGRTILERLCERDRRGQKSGAGFYDYDDKMRPVPSPVVERLIADFATEQGRAPRVFSDDDILDQLLLPMINEAARILQDGKALRGSDIDVVWRNGYGWPIWRGGPCYWADTCGLDAIVTKLAAMAIPVAPLLARLAAEGGSLTTYSNADLVA